MRTTRRLAAFLSAAVLLVAWGVPACTSASPDRAARMRIIDLPGARAVATSPSRVFAVTSREVVRLAPGGGRPIWRHPARPAAGRGAPAPVAVPGGPVVWAEAGAVVAADPVGGRALWRAPHPGGAAEAVTGLSSSGTVVVASGSSGTLVALEARSGARRWVRRLGEGRFVVDGPPVGVSGAVCLTGLLEGAGGRVLCLDASSGTTIWEHDLPGASSGLAASGERLALGVPGGGVTVGVPDGRVRSSVAFDSAFDASVAPVFLSGGVAYCDRLGAVAFTRGGRLLWRRDLGVPFVGAQPLAGGSGLWVPAARGWVHLDARGATIAVATLPGPGGGASVWKGRLLVAVPSVGVAVVAP